MRQYFTTNLLFIAMQERQRYSPSATLFFHSAEVPKPKQKLQRPKNIMF